MQDRVQLGEDIEICSFIECWGQEGTRQPPLRSLGNTQNGAGSLMEPYDFMSYIGKKLFRKHEERQPRSK